MFNHRTLRYLCWILLSGVSLTGCVSSSSTNQMNEAAASLQYLVDRHQIEDIIKQYAMSIDNRDWDLHASLFTPTYLGYNKKKGEFVEQTVEWRVGFLDKFISKFSWTQHIASIYTIEIEGDNAVVISTLNARHKRKPAAAGEKQKNDWHMLGQYRYWLVRTEGGWKINKMRMTSNKGWG